MKQRRLFLTAELYLPTWQELFEMRGSCNMLRWAETPNLEQSKDCQEMLTIAMIAHAAVGQTRADGVTPYLAHPIHVAMLAMRWAYNMDLGYLSDHIVQVALGHDLFEDTKLKPDDLLERGISASALNDMVTLTKADPSAYEAGPYFHGCVQRIPTWIVKAADRVSNLLSAAEDAVPGARNQRWKNYIERTRTEMLPVYYTTSPLDISEEQRIYVSPISM
jgi:(p)ppGpp synthase/HD superfamily hydrolase